MGVWDHHPELPHADGLISITRQADETIVFDINKGFGTEQAGFLSSVRKADGTEQLGIRGRRPSGLIKASERQGDVSIYVKGLGLCVLKGDGDAEVGQELQCDIKTLVAGVEETVTVVASANLRTTSTMTIADDLSAYQKGGGYQLVLTPAGNAAGGTTTVVAKDERGEIVTETFDLRGTTAQTSKHRFTDVMDVTNADYTGDATVTITAAVAKTREIAHGYGKGVDTGGIGNIKAVIGERIYFDI